MMSIVLAIVIGLAFGAVLDRIGASNPNMIGKNNEINIDAKTNPVAIAIPVAGSIRPEASGRFRFVG